LSGSGKNSFSAFLERKGVEFSFKRYFVDALGAMGVGLFASLITGLILKTIGSKAGIPLLVEFGGLASSMVGPAIAVAIAQALHAPAMVVFSCAAVGFAGNTWGGPVGSFLGAVIAAETGKIISKETKIDIIATPAGTIISGMAVAKLAGPTVSAIMTGLGMIIMNATDLQPGPMGAIVSAIMGMILTLPISSAAIAVALNLSGLAAGASAVGCFDTDGRVRSYEFPRKRRFRPAFAGDRDFNAADAEYSQTPVDMGASNACKFYTRPCFDTCIQDGKCAVRSRNGNKRFCRSVRGNRCNGQQCRGTCSNSSYAFHPACSNNSCNR